MQILSRWGLSNFMEAVLHALGSQRQADTRAHWPALRRQHVGCLFLPTGDPGARCESGVWVTAADARQTAEIMMGFERIVLERKPACCPGLWGCELHSLRLLWCARN